MAKQISLLSARERLRRRWRFYNKEFVFDSVSGSFYRLSPVASEILSALLEGADRHTLVDNLSNKYEVDRSIILRDIETFIGSLRAEGVVEHFLPKAQAKL